MKPFKYVAEVGTYFVREVPGHPGMKEHMFYSWVKCVPRGVPSGCNPRMYDINKKTYKGVQESLLMTDDMKDRPDRLSFLLKNRGITVLATSVSVAQLPDLEGREYMQLLVDIPDELGNVDGNHSYHIVDELKDRADSRQMIGIRILEWQDWGQGLVTWVAQGLNTSVQVLDGSLANQRGYFDEIKEDLKDKPYYSWVGWMENQKGVSVQSKTLISILWACNPLIYRNSSKHPNWIYARAQAVFTNGFYGNDGLRKEMLRISHLLPDIIDVYTYVNERAVWLSPKARKTRGKHKDADGKTADELNIKSLCIESSKVAFRQPPPELEEVINNGLVAEKQKKQGLLRECYMMIFLSGLRELITTPTDGSKLQWRYDWKDLYPILTDDAFLKKMLNFMVRQLRHDKGQHDVTQRQPILWDVVATNIGKQVAEDMATKKLQNSLSLPPMLSPAQFSP